MGAPMGAARPDRLRLPQTRSHRGHRRRFPQRRPAGPGDRLAGRGRRSAPHADGLAADDRARADLLGRQRPGDGRADRNARVPRPCRSTTIRATSPGSTNRDPIDEFDAVAPWIANVHIKDYPPADPATPSGCRPARASSITRAHFRALQRIGYQGPISLEPHMDCSAEATRACKNAFERLWQADGADCYEDHPAHRNRNPGHQRPPVAAGTGGRSPTAPARVAIDWLDRRRSRNSRPASVGACPGRAAPCARTRPSPSLPPTARRCPCKRGRWPTGPMARSSSSGSPPWRAHDQGRSAWLPATRRRARRSREGRPRPRRPIEIDTGTLQCRILKRRDFLIDSMTIDGRVVARTAGWSAVLDNGVGVHQQHQEARPWSRPARSAPSSRSKAFTRPHRRARVAALHRAAVLLRRRGAGPPGPHHRLRWRPRKGLHQRARPRLHRARCASRYTIATCASRAKTTASGPNPCSRSPGAVLLQGAPLSPTSSPASASPTKKPSTRAGQKLLTDWAVWDAFKLAQPNADGFTIQKRTNPQSCWLDAIGRTPRSAAWSSPATSRAGSPWE